jgi:hypothetical protein
MYGLSGPKNVLRDRAARSRASRLSVPQKAWTLLPQYSLVTAPTGLVRLTRARYRLTCSARMFVANVADESTPMPFSAATS